MFLLVRLNSYSATVSLISSLMAFHLALGIYGKPSNAAFKMPWIMLILVFPVLGICIYGLFGHKDATKRVRLKFNEIHRELMGDLTQKEQVMKEYLEEAEGKNPQDMAEQILEFARSFSDAERDDMTVLIAGVWKKP